MHHISLDWKSSKLVNSASLSFKAGLLEVLKDNFWSKNKLFSPPVCCRFGCLVLWLGDEHMLHLNRWSQRAWKNTSAGEQLCYQLLITTSQSSPRHAFQLQNPIWKGPRFRIRLTVQCNRVTSKKLGGGISPDLLKVAYSPQMEWKIQPW